MASRGRHGARPVVVEVKPESAAASRVNVAPSSPKVRFTPEALVKPTAKSLNTAETWSFYHFEAHARQCPDCFDPCRVYQRGHELCPAGRAYAEDVAEHVYRKDGEVWSRQLDNDKLVRVEIPSDYDQLRSLLRGMERKLRQQTHRIVPIISYDRTYPISARETLAPEVLDARPREVVVEPESSRSSHRATKAKPRGYRPVATDDVDIRPSWREEADHRRGSLYADDLRRQKGKHCQIKVVAPERRERQRPQSEYWA